MQQFEVLKSDFKTTRIVTVPDPEITTGEILVEIEKFGFSANNITYAVMGETLNYWKFFPASSSEWGQLPVWGFAVVVASHCDDVQVGERLFGYFPPANMLKMKPAGMSKSVLFDAADHRSELPRGYNSYQRVMPLSAATDVEKMLLFPLYITSFCIWDQLVELNWYGAAQIIVLSASSKTSLGLAYALRDDPNAPRVIGLTSGKNLASVEAIGIYDAVFSYDDLNMLSNCASTLVDMSGNGTVLGQLHTMLGNNMCHTINVGLTHWDIKRSHSAIMKDRSDFFFAPARIQQRMGDWGVQEFNKRAGTFVSTAAAQSRDWLRISDHAGLEGLEGLYGDVCEGSIAPELGLAIKMR